MSGKLTPEMLAQLSTTGLSSKAVAERLGIGQKAAARLLIATGAKQNEGQGWRSLGRPACSAGSWKR